jgi:CDP-diglyceride synthetase
MEMADAVTAAIGTVIMIGYIWLIADKLNELPLWIACIAGIALMIFAFWQDAWKPIIKRNSN